MPNGGQSAGGSGSSPSGFAENASSPAGGTWVPALWCAGLRTRPAPRDTARAMSQENVEVVRRAFNVYFTRGVDALLEEHIPLDGVWHTAPEWIEASEYRGHEGIRSLLSVFPDNFDDWRLDVIELRDSGDSVVALIEHGGKIKGTDTPIHQPMGVVFSDFREGGQVGRFHSFQTWREALEAAGLQE
jgi:ketosteroid isomerase-like protein